MKKKNPIFKFSKKSPKSSKILEYKKQKNLNDYSKIYRQVLDKNKEESKNNNINHLNNNEKINNINNNNNISDIQILNKYSKNIIKIQLNPNKKNSKNNIKEESKMSFIKQKKKNYTNKQKKTKNFYQSNSEKNMKKEIISEEGIKKNISTNNKINNTNTKVTSLNKNRKININLNTDNDNFMFRKQKSFNNKKEANANKSISTEKKIGDKVKNVEEIKEKTTNIQCNINEFFGNKKGNEHIRQFYRSNNNTNEKKSSESKNKRKVINQKLIKNNKNLNVNVNNSPDKIIIKINNVGSYNTGSKNKNNQKRIHKNNTGINSNDIDSKKLKMIKNKKKYIIHNNTDNSPNNQVRKSSKISSKKKYIINIKNNDIKNLSNSKINDLKNQNSNLKGIKVESINIDLNLSKPKNEKLCDSQKKSDKDNSLNDKNSLTLRETEIPKYLTKVNPIQKKMEFSIMGPNDNNELNHSFKTAFSITKKTRSLSRKRDEKKKMNWFKLNEINDDEMKNEKKLNDILLNLSNHIDVDVVYRNTGQKSEPKKLIDKIRKVKKLKKI